MRELFKTISLAFLLTSLYFYLFLFLLKKLGVAKKVENDQKQKLWYQKQAVGSKASQKPCRVYV